MQWCISQQSQLLLTAPDDHHLLLSGHHVSWWGWGLLCYVCSCVNLSLKLVITTVLEAKREVVEIYCKNVGLSSCSGTTMGDYYDTIILNHQQHLLCCGDDQLQQKYVWSKIYYSILIFYSLTAVVFFNVKSWFNTEPHQQGRETGESPFWCIIYWRQHHSQNCKEQCVCYFFVYYYTCKKEEQVRRFYTYIQEYSFCYDKVKFQAYPENILMMGGLILLCSREW
jgi:hypothetical protein